MELIKSFMYKCPTCNTGIQFDAPELTSITQIMELSNAITKLTCPKCCRFLGDDAKKAYDAIKAYNEIVDDFLHIYKNVQLNMVQGNESE